MIKYWPLLLSINLSSSLSLLFFGRFFGSKGSLLLGILSSLFSSYLIILLFSSYLSYNIPLSYPSSYTLKECEGGEWVILGNKEIIIDPLLNMTSLVLILLILIFTSGIFLYSYWYLKEDPHWISFGGLLLAFGVAMVGLVFFSSFFLLFLFWETVGLFSFFLILFWSSSLDNLKSALQALFFNTFGDLSFLLALLSLTISPSSLDWFSFLLPHSYIPTLSQYGSDKDYLIWIGFLGGSIIKSALFLGHPWLGNAMAGPTPVSALLHAATMVTAGIILWIRIGGSPSIIEYYNWTPIITIWGLISFLFAGFLSFNLYDFKKVIAFSTSSHLSLMFLSLPSQQLMGGDYSSISLYHLFTHASFKALLFLTSGLLIHLYGGLSSQDSRFYSSLSITTPLLSSLLFFSSLSLFGWYSFSGFFSKDLSLLSSLSPLPPFYSPVGRGEIVIEPKVILIVASLFSFLYSFSLFLMSFSSIISKSIYKAVALPYYLLPFLFLLFIASISFSWILSPILSPIYTHPFFSDSFFTIPLNYDWGIVKNEIGGGILPTILIIVGGIVFILTRIGRYWPSKSILRISIESILSLILWFPSFSLSYKFSTLDRGSLEALGPLSLARIFSPVSTL